MNAFFNFNQDFTEIVLISASPFIVNLIESLRQHNYTGKIILIEDKARPLQNVPDSLLDHRITIDPENIDDIIPYILSLNAPLACVAGWYKIFKKNFISLFDNRILNIHMGDLPNYRGAGGGSWQVLNGEKKIFSHVHQLTLEVDRGAILFSESEDLPEIPYPVDVKATGIKAAYKVLSKLAQAIINKENIALEIQDEQNATYFPRLKTDLNGWINFSWTPNDVERFIRAFSDPYMGASFQYANDTFRVKKSWLRNSKIHFHPFCHGLIVNIENNSLHVVCDGGIICLSDIYDINQVPVSVKKFKIGKSIATHAELLSKAKYV